ncbi:MAG: Mov34/MPN/PAD-1 family protein, partial [Thermomicrobiaceae bacterium]|nr:Mov34/MPN/PAD-1 family protein [Thermomicrobiaceae bacterium]
RGWQLGAIFHSHPDTPARPSLTDLRHAYYPEALMVIVSFQTDPPTTRAYQVRVGDDAEIVREVPIEIVEPEPAPHEPPAGPEVGERW